MAEAKQRLEPLEASIKLLGVSRLALFGSVLKEATKETSDVDFLVSFLPGEKDFDRFLSLAEMLEEQLGRKVELVTTESLSPYIGPKIVSEAVDVIRFA